jgi:hypothetical protein
MVTWAKAGIHKPNSKYTMAATMTTISPVPMSTRVALRDPNGLQAMKAEHEALIRNRTWTLVDRPARCRVITRKWVFKHKLWSDGTL